MLGKEFQYRCPYNCQKQSLTNTLLHILFLCFTTLVQECPDWGCKKWLSWQLRASLMTWLLTVSHTHCSLVQNVAFWLWDVNFPYSWLCCPGISKLCEMVWNCFGLSHGCQIPITCRCYRAAVQVLADTIPGHGSPFVARCPRSHLAK